MLSTPNFQWDFAEEDEENIFVASILKIQLLSRWGVLSGEFIILSPLSPE
jgi:hypothetical protein